MDCITIKGVVGYGYHGVYPEETKLGQRFLVHMKLYLDTRSAVVSDDVRQTVNYGDVYRIIQGVLTGPPMKLIETVGDKIARIVLMQWPMLDHVVVTIEKPSAPIPGVFDTVSVDIVRSQQDVR